MLASLLAGLGPLADGGLVHGLEGVIPGHACVVEVGLLLHLADLFVRVLLLTVAVGFHRHFLITIYFIPFKRTR